MRFGIEMNTDHTLEEVGKQFDVTRERIRQIEAKALRKLRHPVAPITFGASLMSDFALLHISETLAPMVFTGYNGRPPLSALPSAHGPLAQLVRALDS